MFGSSSSTAPTHTVAVTPVTGSPAPKDAADKAHHNKDGSKGVFHNPWASYKEPEGDVIVTIMKARGRFSLYTHPSTAEAHMPITTPTFTTERFGTDPNNLRATWLGHACWLIEFPSGLRVLFDPVMTDRCSPTQWFGPKRFSQPPCQIKDIPIVDAVIISHDHYDHLSYPGIKEIQKHFPKAHFFVPLGNESWFHSSGIKSVTELDWWEEADLTLTFGADGELKQGSESIASSTDRTITGRFSCLPCQHNTGRTPFGMNKTLWASWAVKSPASSAADAASGSVYFGGDTAYRSVPHLENQDDDYGPDYEDLPRCPVFAQIGELHGPFSLGLLPIGSYEHRALLGHLHSSPRDSVEIFSDTKCKRALGMHWGTWVMSDEDVRDPPIKLAEALVTRKLPAKGTFDVCALGESTLIAL